MTSASFNQMLAVQPAYDWQVQAIAAALAPAVNADGTLDYAAAVTAAEQSQLTVAGGTRGTTLISKKSLPATQIPTLLPNNVQQLGLNPTGTLAGVLHEALIPVFTIGTPEQEPWFSWGTMSPTSTAYYCNLLLAWTNSEAPGPGSVLIPEDLIVMPGYIGILVLNLEVTVELSQQQLLALQPGTSAVFTVSAVAVSGAIEAKAQAAPAAPPPSASSSSAGPFSQVTLIPSAYEWQLPAIATALAPAVNADGTLNHTVGMAAAEHAHVLLAGGTGGTTLVTKDNLPGIGIVSQLREKMPLPLNLDRSDPTLPGLLQQALAPVFTVSAIEHEPWFTWGAMSAASTTYYCNLLLAWTNSTNQPAQTTILSVPPGCIGILVLNLEVTVELSQQQLLALQPGTSAVFTVSAVAVGGTIEEKAQP